MECTCRWLRDSAAATGKRISALGTGISGAVMLAVLLVGLGPVPAHAQTFSCANDAQGVNDQPGQKDLTKMCVAPGSGSFQLYTKWDWDETGTSGNNTMDACSLYDTDGDGNANLAVCVTTIDDPAVEHAVTLYSCVTDSRSDRCIGAVVVTAVATT